MFVDQWFERRGKGEVPQPIASEPLVYSNHSNLRLTQGQTSIMHHAGVQCSRAWRMSGEGKGRSIAGLLILLYYI